MDRQDSITESDLNRMLFDETREPMRLPFSLLERITKGFSHDMAIGRGGFATVYKGILEGGIIAVKKLSSTYMHEKEFIREVECLMKIKHKNIVRFLGYCSDTQGNMEMYDGKFVMAEIQQRLLCLAYLPNGGLDRYIKDPSCGLGWADRYDIIKGICEGLDHLHQINIVHMDLKPANILLDENMEPQITDFGISRTLEENQTRVDATKVVGTTGYMPPERFSKQITKKYDLYSLGVIVMEILTGEKMCYDAETITTREKVSHVVETVVKSWSDRLSISRRTEQCEQIRACVEIGIECTEFDPANRPANVKHILERLPQTERTERTEEIMPKIKMLDFVIKSSSRSLHSLDANHAKQWIITGEDNGHIRIWNYQTREKVDSFKLSERSEVVCVKFIARKQWFVAASGNNMYLYSYETKMLKITSINAGSRDKSVNTLAVHPTKPYLLSSDYGNIKLWNWDKNWECTHIFEANNSEAFINQIALSLKGTIVSASIDYTLKVCSLDSAKSNYTLSGHSASVKCLDFFTWDDQEYLVTGSDDRTAKIWDMQHQICLCTMKAFKSPVMFIFYRTDLQVLITGSQDGSICLWRICSRIRRRAPKLEQTINIEGGTVLAFACSMGRVVIAKKDAVAIMDIDYVNSLEKSTDYSELQLSADMRRDGDKMAKVLRGSNEELPILDVHPLELSFPEPNQFDHFSRQPSEFIMCTLKLTNKTDAHVAFRITEETRDLLQCSSEMYGIVPSRSTHTLIVTPGQIMMQREEIYFNLGVQSSTTGERYIALFISQSECDEFFEEAEEMGNTVHEVTLQSAVCSPQRDRIFKYYNELPPLKHRFYPELLSDSIPALLHLTNKTDGHVVYRLMEKISDFSFYNSIDSIYGTVPPRSTCTLIMSDKEKKLAGKKGTDLVLQSSIPGDKNTKKLLQSRYNCRIFFEEAKELGHAVYEVALQAVYTPSQEETSSEPAVRPTVRPTVIQHILPPYSGSLRCMDAHPSEPWIVLGTRSGDIHIWNHDSKTMMGSFKISKEEVRSIKFHAAKKWIVAGSDDKFIHVYDCASVTQIQKITSFKDPQAYSVGIHPTKPYLLSPSTKLWDGDKGWECTRTFGAYHMRQLAFNPEDPNSFATLSYSMTVELWSLDSLNNRPDYELMGHSDSVKCLDFFKCGDRPYLITGSDDCTAKIWDLQKRACIHTMEVFMSPVVYVISVPHRPYLVTRSENNAIYVWSSTDFRLKTSINFSCAWDYVVGPVCLMGSRSIAVGHDDKLTIMDINDDDDGEVIASEGNNEAISVEIGSEEVVAHEGNNEAISGRVVVGQEKASSIIGTGNEVEAVANEGSNKQSIA